MEPEIHRIRDAEIRVFNREPNYDGSDMYVMEVLGVTVNVRLLKDGTPKVVVETEVYPMDAEVCGVDSTYG